MLSNIHFVFVFPRYFGVIAKNNLETLFKNRVHALRVYMEAEKKHNKSFLCTHTLVQIYTRAEKIKVGKKKIDFFLWPRPRRRSF